MKNYIKGIQENLSIITLFPFIIGGILQVLILGSIGLGYIRFFSVSQVLSDGLLILSIIITGFIGSILPKLYFDGKFEGIYSASDLIKKKKKETNAILLEDYIAITISIILSIFSFWILYESYRSFNFSNQDNISKILGIALAISFAIELLASSLGTLFDRKSMLYKNISDSSSTRSILRTFLYITLVLYISVQICSIVLDESKIEKYFYQGFTFPNNLRNIKELELTNNEKIIYFNDKFIFIKDTRDSNIKVLEFGSLFSKK